MWPYYRDHQSGNMSFAVQDIVFVNEYALVSTIGRGSFGEVKLALNTTDFEVYALKLLPKEVRRKRGMTASNPLFAEDRVMSEINVMKQLCHPNIVRLVEVIGETDVPLYHPTCPT